jgi:5-methylcytosine-specific restriction endonuclease McrA
MGFETQFKHGKKNYSCGWVGNVLHGVKGKSQGSWSLAIDAEFISVATDEELVRAIRNLRVTMEENLQEYLASEYESPNDKLPSWDDIKPKNRARRAITQVMRDDVYERDNFTCRYCGDRRRLTCDHVIPFIQGGPTTLDNLVTCCKSCNSSKGGRTPEEAGMELRTIE